MSTWSHDLRPAQQQVAGSAEATARLLAGPGTGKTHVLVRRAQFLLAANLAPYGLLALTFTRAAAAEMRTRLSERLAATPDGAAQAALVKVATLHSYALGLLLRSRIDNLPQPLRIAGDWEERHVITEELKTLLSRDVKEVKAALIAMANDWDQLASDHQDWVEGGADPAFVGAWQAHRRIYGYTLRGELVYQLLQGLRADPGLEPRERPSVLLVDEYQDLNRCDLATVRELARRCDAAVFGAGDDDQSIYSFRSAAPAGIRDFLSDYPGAADLTLQECLRCGPQVVALANWLIEQELGRVPKTLVSASGQADAVTLLALRDQHEEATGIAALIDAALASGTAPQDILVLFKSDPSGRNSKALVSELQTRGHHVYLPRQQDTEDADLVRLRQYLQLAQARREARIDHLALRSLLELEPNSVGATLLGHVLQRAVETGAQWADALDALRDPTTPGKPGPALRKKLLAAADDIVARADAMAPQSGEDLLAYLERVASVLQLDPALLQRVHLLINSGAVAGTEHGEPSDRPASGTSEQDVLKVMAEVEDDRVQQLIAALNGLSEALPARLEDHVTITTMHGAKGLTASAVFVCQLEDETFPGDGNAAAEAEARRLLYVSVTRARHQLYLCYCLQRTGSQQYGRGAARGTGRHLSRFLVHYGLTAQNVAGALRP